MGRGVSACNIGMSLWNKESGKLAASAVATRAGTQTGFLAEVPPCVSIRSSVLDIGLS